MANAPLLAFPVRRLKLRTLIAILFTSLIIVSVSVVSYLSNRGVRETVDFLAYDLEARSLESIFQHLNTLIHRPMAINAVNLEAASSGMLKLDDPAAAADHFWRVGAIFPNIGTIAFADAKGNYVGANRPENYYVLSRGDMTGGAIRRFEPAAGGAFSGKVLSDSPNYDPRKRDWYASAVKAGAPAWTEVSLSVTTRRIDLTAVTPLYEKGALRGVFMVDLPLTKIDEFLSGLEIAKRGRVYVVDRAGLLIGSSDDSPLSGPGADAKLERVPATMARDRLVAGTATEIATSYGGFSSVIGPSERRMTVDGEKLLVTVAPFQRPGGINWVVVLALPEREVFGAFDRNALAISGFGVLAVLAALAAAILLAWWVTKPLAMLNEAAKDLAQGHWAERKELTITRGDEVGELAESFNEMAARLKVSMARLHSEMAITARQASELAESERRNLALLAAIPDVFFTARPDGAIEDVHGADSGLFRDLAVETLAGRNLAEVLLPEVSTALLDAIGEVLSTGLMQVREFATTRDGDDCYYEARIVTGGAREAVVLCRDVTGERRAEAERLRLEQRLTEAHKMEAIGTLAGGVAHDFNNLLQVVSGRLELLRAHVGEGVGRESMVVIEKAVDRAAGLVQGLLTFAHKVERKRRPVDLNEEVRLTAQMIERTLPKMIEVRIELAPGLPPILADSNQLQQVLLNLAANARDAMSGGGVLTISTGDTQPGRDFRINNPGADAVRFVSLAVADTGTGIPDEVAHRVFEPFFTTKEVGKGTGLGLSIVYGIVRDHGGHIDFTTRAGEGTVFNLYFPVTDAKPEAEKARPDPALEKLVGKETVLVVDDEADIGKMLASGLESLGFTVLTATSGEECLEIHARMKGSIDLIVLDMGMPGMGGLACLKALRRVDTMVKVLVASGYGPQAEEETEGLADGFLSKPYRLADLVRKMRDMERA